MSTFFNILKEKSVLLWGKIRRFYYGHFEGNKVKKKLTLRRGECARCGACCKLMFTCPFLVTHIDGTTSCMIHRRRPLNCRIFPVDMQDIRDRDLIDKVSKCGFYFESEGK